MLKFDNSSSVTSFWKKVMNLECLPKIRFFIWRIFARMLPVNMLLIKYNSRISTVCPLCDSEDETVMHLFIYCPIALHIWFALGLD